MVRPVQLISILAARTPMALVGAPILLGVVREPRAGDLRCPSLAAVARRSSTAEAEREEQRERRPYHENDRHHAPTVGVRGGPGLGPDGPCFARWPALPWIRAASGVRWGARNYHVGTDSDWSVRRDARLGHF